MHATIGRLGNERIYPRSFANELAFIRSLATCEKTVRARRIAEDRWELLNTLKATRNSLPEFGCAYLNRSYRATGTEKLKFSNTHLNLSGYMDVCWKVGWKLQETRHSMKELVQSVWVGRIAAKQDAKITEAVNRAIGLHEQPNNNKVHYWRDVEHDYRALLHVGDRSFQLDPTWRCDTFAWRLDTDIRDLANYIGVVLKVGTEVAKTEFGSVYSDCSIVRNVKKRPGVFIGEIVTGIHLATPLRSCLTETSEHNPVGEFPQTQPAHIWVAGIPSGKAACEKLFMDFARKHFGN
jgi:hypothetical protein